MKKLTNTIQNLINDIKSNFKEDEGYDIYIKSIKFDTDYQRLYVEAIRNVKDENKDYRSVEIDFEIDPVDLEQAEKDIVG